MNWNHGGNISTVDNIFETSVKSINLFVTCMAVFGPFAFYAFASFLLTIRSHPFTQCNNLYSYTLHEATFLATSDAILTMFDVILNTARPVTVCEKLLQPLHKSIYRGLSK